MDSDRTQPKIKLLRTVIMVTGTKISALRKTNMVADDDNGKIVDPKLFSQPTMIPY